MLFLHKACQKIIEISFYLLFFLVPLVMTPWNFELFEFNKMLLVYFLTGTIAFAWLLEIIIEKKVVLRRTFWDIPLFIFLVSQLLSYFISIDRQTSFWGYYSRFNGGLLSTISYALLYWAYVSHMDRPKTVNVVRYLLVAGVVVSAYGIAEHFGIDAKYWVQDVRNRVFSTLGQPNWLAAWLVALVPITWALIVSSKHEFRIFFSYFLFAILFLCLLYTKSRSGIMGLGVAYLIFWGSLFFFNRTNIQSFLRPFLTLNFFLLILILLIGTPWTPSISDLKSKIINPNSSSQQSPSQAKANPSEEMPSGLLISESGDIRKVVWSGATDIWRHYPVLGTGVETFAYSYYWYRPREHNDLSEWDFLYNKAHNEYLNYAATTGIIGLGAYLFLISAFIFWSIKIISNFQFLISKQVPKSNDQISLKLDQLGQLKIRLIILALLSGFASILATNFFGFSVVAISLLFFLIPAFSHSLAKPAIDSPTLSKKGSAKVIQLKSFSKKQTVAVIVLAAAFGFFSLMLIQYWRADAAFAAGVKSYNLGGSAEAFVELQKAIKMRSEPFYYDQLGLAAADLAISFNNQKDATASSRLADYALSQSAEALSVNPYNINFLKDRTKIAYKLAEINENYYSLALDSLLRAQKLAPTDAKVSYNLALIYARLDSTDKATETLQKTIELKPNYDAAHYALALFYEKAGEKDLAIEHLNYILEKINSTYEPAVEKINQLNP